jgi:hypothetical protein
MTVVPSLTLIFAIFRTVAWAIWLVPAPGTMTHNAFESLTSFVLLLLCLPVLLSLPHPHHHFISDITVWVIFVDLDYLVYFIEVF